MQVAIYNAKGLLPWSNVPYVYIHEAHAAHLTNRWRTEVFAGSNVKVTPYFAYST